LIRLIIIEGTGPFISVLLPLLRLLRPLLLWLSLRLTLCRSLIGLSGLLLTRLLLAGLLLAGLLLTRLLLACLLLTRHRLVLLGRPRLVLLLLLHRQLLLRIRLRLVWLLRLRLLLFLLPRVLRLRRPLSLGLWPPGLLLLLWRPGPVRLFLLLTGTLCLPVWRRAVNPAGFAGISSIYCLLVENLIYKILFLEELCPLNFELLCYLPQFGNKHFAQFKNIMHVLKMCRKISTIDFLVKRGMKKTPSTE
jgi:hypothetical protein